MGSHCKGTGILVLHLLKCHPKGISFLQVVRSLLVALAHHETYHALFNRFIQENPLILEEKECGFLKHCMGLLDYRNKLQWISRKLKMLQ